jgi:hypothetical protein
MRRDTAIVAVILALLVIAGQTALGQTRPGGVAEPFGPDTRRGTASISGRVLATASNVPVRGAEVVATNERGGRVAATTDENGAYRIDRLSEGPWRVTVSKSGYVTWQFGQRRAFQPPPPILLTRDQQFAADIALTRGGVISGRIYDAAGDAVAGAQVRVYRARIERGARRLKPVGVTDLTDDMGAFRVYGLPPGDYYVAASMRVAPIDSIVETTYVPTYFPGTGDLAEAQRIRLALGAEAAATFPLLPVRPTRISGLVVSASGAPADAFLNLVSEGSELGRPIGTGGVTRSDGTFTLPDVAPGRYMLKAVLRGDGPDEAGAAPVTVDGNELSGITVVTARPATLRGAIVPDDGASGALPANLSVLAYSAHDKGTVIDSGQGLAFEIGSLSEPFHLTVDGLPRDWAVKEIVVSGMDALDSAIVLSPAEQGIARVVLTNRVTEVTGVVSQVVSTPASIVVFPEDTAKWGHRSRYVRRVDSDASGTFRITGLPPGEQYLAVALDYVEDEEHLDPEFLTTIKSAAFPFLLKDAEKRTLNLNVVER